MKTERDDDRSVPAGFKSMLKLYDGLDMESLEKNMTLTRSTLHNQGNVTAMESFLKRKMSKQD